MSACPQCKSGELVQRRNKSNGASFWGCSEFPRCKFAIASLDRLRPGAPEAAPSAASEPSPATSNDELAAVLRELVVAVRSLTESLQSKVKAT